MNCIKKLLKIFGYIVVMILIAYFIEKLLFKNYFPFCWISFEKSEWFSFLGSYLGAIAAVVLGCISLWQTKKYKEQSEKYEKQMNEMLIRPDFYIEIIDDCDFQKSGNYLNRSAIIDNKDLITIYLRCHSTNNPIIELDIIKIIQNDINLNQDGLVANTGCLYIKQNEEFFIETSTFLSGKTTIEFVFKNIYNDEYIKKVHFNCDKDHFTEIEKLEISELKKHDCCKGV